MNLLKAVTQVRYQVPSGQRFFRTPDPVVVRVVVLHDNLRDAYVCGTDGRTLGR